MLARIVHHTKAAVKYELTDFDADAPAFVSVVVHQGKNNHHVSKDLKGARRAYGKLEKHDLAEASPEDLCKQIYIMAKAFGDVHPNNNTITTLLARTTFGLIGQIGYLHLHKH